MLNAEFRTPYREIGEPQRPQALSSDMGSDDVLLSCLSSSGLSSAISPFISLDPFKIDGANLDEPAFTCSPDRQFLAIVCNADEQVAIVPISTISEGKPVARTLINENSVSNICFSCKSSWICTWRKPISETDLNMAIWSTATGNCILRKRHARLNRYHGDPAQWTSDESSVWIQSGSELLGFEISPNSSHDPDRNPYMYRLHVPGMVRFWLSPSVEPSYRVMVLTAEKNSEPARCSIYNANAFDTVVCSKSFYQSDDVEGYWSPAGHAALVKASAAHDASGKSYYGSASLYLLPADGYNPPTTIVSAGTDGACADAQWNPVKSKREFGVVCGRRAWICNSSNGKCMIDFGRNAWNTFRWSPSGR